MSKFTFSLEPVLRHRLRLEQQAQRVVAERAAGVTRLQDELSALNADLSTSTAQLRSQHLVGSLDLAYLTAHRRYTADVARRGTLLMQRIAVAQRGVDEARARLIEAAKQRRAMETLREKQEARWRADQARRELAEADDATSRLTHASLREGAEEVRPA